MISALYGMEQKKNSQFNTENGGGYHWWGWEWRVVGQIQGTRVNRLIV